MPYADPEKERAFRARQRIKNRDKIREKQKLYRENNKEKIKARRAEWLANRATDEYKERTRSYNKTWSDRNREKQRSTAREWYHSNKNGSLDRWIARLINTSRINSRKVGRECTITTSDLLKLFNTQEGKCAATGLVMTLERFNPKALSLDRIDSKVGYVNGNVQLVCKWVNLGKSNADDKLFREVLSEFKNL